MPALVHLYQPYHGGVLVFGMEDKTGKLVGIDKAVADEIVELLANLCRSDVGTL
jgi:hypothetical protein